jgi:hypothetical protein
MNQHFDTSRICPNGHLLTDAKQANWPLYNDNFCKVCGEKLIDKCPNCTKEIRGARVRDDPVMGTEVFPAESVPGYCWNCGRSYPWTAKFLSATRELINGFHELTETEKSELAQSFDDVVRQVPDQGKSIEGMKRLWRKLRKPSQDLLNNLAGNGIYDVLKRLFS